LSVRRDQKSVSLFQITEKSEPAEIGQARQISAFEPGDFIQEAVNGELDIKRIPTPLLCPIHNESSETKSVVRRSRRKSIKLVDEELKIDVPVEVIILSYF